jgi:N-acetyl-anhydromuramyl-L-alanine amidase AmpD
MRNRGAYRGGLKGAVVHFTAGNYGSLPEAVDCIKFGAKQGYSYLCIASTGELVQAHDASQWGYHCGDSHWPSLGSGLSNQLIGIEICCAGKLKKSGDHYVSWFGKSIEAKYVRSSQDHDYQGETGVYHKYTPQQEATLIKTLFWLKTNFPSFSFDCVLGHDEISPRRKNDPGASLSMPMPEFRKFLEKHFEPVK